MSWQPRIYRAIQSWRLPETPVRSLATAAGGRKTNQQERAIRLRNMAKKGKIGLEGMPKASRVRPKKLKYEGPSLSKAEHRRATSGRRQEAFKASEEINDLTTQVLKGTLEPTVALASAKQMVEDSRRPRTGDSSSILYSQLIRLSVLAKKGQEAFKLFNQMKKFGMTPSFRTMSNLLKFGLKDLDPDPAVNTILTSRFEKLFSDLEILREQALDVVSATRAKQDGTSALPAKAGRDDVLEEIRRDPTRLAVAYGAFCSWLASYGQQDRSLTIAERFHGKFEAIIGGFPHITNDLLTAITVAFLRSSHEITDQSAGRLAVLWRRYLQTSRDRALQEDEKTSRSGAARGKRPADTSPSQHRGMRLVDIASKTQHPDLCDVTLEMLQGFTDLKPFGQKAMPQGSLPEGAHGQEIALAYVYGTKQEARNIDKAQPGTLPVRRDLSMDQVLQRVVLGSSYKSEYPITWNFFMNSAWSVLKARKISSLKSRPGEPRSVEKRQIPLAQWKLMGLAYDDARAARQLSFPSDAFRLLETIQELRHADIIRADLPFWCYFDALQTLSKGPEGAHNPDLNRLIAMYLEGRCSNAAADATLLDSSVESVLGLATQILVDQTGSTRDLDATASDAEVFKSPGANITTTVDDATSAVKSTSANSKNTSLPSEVSQAMDGLFDFFIALRASIASAPGKDDGDLQPSQIPFRSVEQLRRLDREAKGGKSIAAKKTNWQLSQSYLTLIEKAMSIPQKDLKPEQKKVLPFMQTLRVRVQEGQKYMRSAAWGKAVQQGVTEEGGGSEGTPDRGRKSDGKLKVKAKK